VIKSVFPSLVWSINISVAPQCRSQRRAVKPERLLCNTIGSEKAHFLLPPIYEALTGVFTTSHRTPPSVTAVQRARRQGTIPAHCTSVSVSNSSSQNSAASGPARTDARQAPATTPPAAATLRNLVRDAPLSTRPAPTKEGLQSHGQGMLPRAGGQEASSRLPMQAEGEQHTRIRILVRTKTTVMR
jgi:hypothetical protein